MAIVIMLMVKDMRRARDNGIDVKVLCNIFHYQHWTPILVSEDKNQRVYNVTSIK